MADSFVKHYVFPHLRISTLGRTLLSPTLKEKILQSLIHPSHESSILNQERMQVPAAHCLNAYSNSIWQVNFIHLTSKTSACPHLLALFGFQLNIKIGQQNSGVSSFANALHVNRDYNVLRNCNNNGNLSYNFLWGIQSLTSVTVWESHH